MRKREEERKIDMYIEIRESVGRKKIVNYRLGGTGTKMEGEEMGDPSVLIDHPFNDYSYNDHRKIHPIYVLYSLVDSPFTNKKKFITGT